MIINKTLLAQYSPLPIPSNYNYADIMNYVPVAEEIWIKKTIGEDLYDEINEQVANNEVSSENATLMTEGKLLQYLAYATCYEGLPFIYAHFSEVGITTAKSEVSQSISLKELGYITDHLRRQVEYLKDSVIKWLCERSETFPLISQCQCDCCTALCCDTINAKLNTPNKYIQLYSTNKKCTTLI